MSKHRAHPTPRMCWRNLVALAAVALATVASTTGVSALATPLVAPAKAVAHVKAAPSAAPVARVQAAAPKVETISVPAPPATAAQAARLSLDLPAGGPAKSSASMQALAQATLPLIVNCQGVRLQSGPNLRRYFSTVWMGTFCNNGRQGVCAIDYTYGLWAGQNWISVSLVSGLNPTQKLQILFLDSWYGNPVNGVQGAALAMAENVISNKPGFMGDYAGYRAQLSRVPGALGLLDVYLAQARAYYGPATAMLTLVNRPVPGQIGTAVFTVRSSIRHIGLPSRPVRFINSASAVAWGPQPTRTNANGQAVFHYRVTGLNPRPDVFVTGLPAAHNVIISVPSPGNQRLIAASPAESAQAPATYTVSPVGPTVSAVCTTKCPGVVPVVICGTNAVGALIMQQAAVINGVRDVTKLVQLASGAHGCITPFNEPDRTLVQTDYRFYLGGGIFTPWARFALSTLVVCPPLPVIADSATCPCDGGEARLLSVPTNVTKNVQEAIVNGVRHLIAPGQSFTMTVLIPIGGSATWRSGAFGANNVERLGTTTTVSLS